MVLEQIAPRTFNVIRAGPPVATMLLTPLLASDRGCRCCLMRFQPLPAEEGE